VMISPVRSRKTKQRMTAIDHRPRNIHLSAALCLAALCCVSSVPAVTFEYAPVEQLMGKDIKGLQLRAKNYAAFHAMQFGPGPKDVVYLIFDCRKRYWDHDVMFVYVPDHKTYGTPVAIKGREEDGRIVFKQFKLAAKFSDIDIAYKIKLSSKTLWNKGKLDLDTEITCSTVNSVSRNKCRFALIGSYLVPVHSFRVIEPVHVVEPPSLKVSWDHRSNPPGIRCRLLVGRQRLVPEAGFESRAQVVISDEDGKVRHRKNVKIEAGTAGDFTYKQKKKLTSATLYKAEVTVDLGELFGVSTRNATTVVSK
jgi:hypothetical protein